MAIKVKSAITGGRRLGPLGVLPEFLQSKSVGHDILEKLRFLESFDMERERAIVMLECKLTEMKSHLIIREFKRFFALELLFPNPDYSFVPSIEIDPVWHHLVLDSRRYVTLCEKLYDGYVHHIPMDTCPKELAENAGEKYGYTKTLLTTAFGAAPPDAWGVAAKCNTAACTWP
jgi:hypothetical protein